MRRRAATLLTLGAATPVLTGCGASNAIDPAVVANAADRTAGAGEARMAMTVQAAGQTIRGDGLMDLGGKRFAMTMQLPGAGQMEMRYLGQVIYLHLPAGARTGLPSGKPWLKLDLGRLLQRRGIDLSSLQSTTGGNPSDTIQQLRGAGDVRKVGTETVRGVSTTHYEATVDLRRAMAKLPPNGRASLQRLIKATGRPTIPVDVWIDGQGRLRRERFAQRIRGQQVSGTIELYGFGDNQAIVSPPAGQTADVTSRIPASALGG